MNPLIKLLRKRQHKNNDARIAANPNNYSVFQVMDVPYLSDGSEYHLLDVYSPDTTNTKHPVVVDIHGGAYVSCFKEMNRQQAQYIASKGFHAVNINYTLYSEGDYRTAVKDVFAVFSWVYEHAQEYGFDTENVFVTGDSAGGHLTLCVAAAAAKEASARYFGVGTPAVSIKGYALSCPAADMEEVITEGQGLAAMKLAMIKLYRDREYLKQTSYHTLIQGGFPDIMIITTPADNLIYRHTNRLHQEMEAAGIVHIYKEYPEKANKLEHVFNILYPDYEESREANDDIIAYFNKRTEE